jgi:hypothetical protein
MAGDDKRLLLRILYQVFCDVKLKGLIYDAADKIISEGFKRNAEQTLKEKAGGG